MLFLLPVGLEIDQEVGEVRIIANLATIPWNVLVAYTEFGAYPKLGVRGDGIVGKTSAGRV